MKTRIADYERPLHAEIAPNALSSGIEVNRKRADVHPICYQRNRNGWRPCAYLVDDSLSLSRYEIRTAINEFLECRGNADQQLATQYSQRDCAFWPKIGDIEDHLRMSQLTQQQS